METRNFSPLEKGIKSLAQIKTFANVTSVSISKEWHFITWDKEEINLEGASYTASWVVFEWFVPIWENYFVTKLVSDLDWESPRFYNVKNKRETNRLPQVKNLTDAKEFYQNGYSYSINAILFLVKDDWELFALKLSPKSSKQFEEFYEKTWGWKKFRVEPVKKSGYYLIDFEEAWKADEIPNETLSEFAFYVDKYNSKFKPIEEFNNALDDNSI